MKKFYKAIRILLIAFFTAYVVSFTIPDLFFTSKDHTLLFLVWQFPFLYLWASCIKLSALLMGRHYRKHDTIVIAKRQPIYLPTTVRKDTGITRLFFVININDHARIVSGIYRNDPTTIWTYTDAFDKPRTLTPYNFVWPLIHIIAACILTAVILFLSFKYVIHS